MKIVMTGPVFIAKGVPGFGRLLEVLPGTPPTRALSCPTRVPPKAALQQAKGTTELHKAIAETGGIPYLMEMTMKIEGGGSDGRDDEQDDGRIGIFQHRHRGLDRRRGRRQVRHSCRLQGQGLEVTTDLSLADQLTAHDSVIAAELRPPRAELAASEGMDAWIDTYHAVRGLTRRGVPVFLTDSAVGLQEEDNLRHLIANLGTSVATQPGRAVFDLETPARVLPLVRRARLAQRLQVARGAGRRQARRPAAVGRARVAASSRHPGPRAAPGTRRMGQSQCGCRSPDWLSRRRHVQRGVLPDTDRVAPHDRAGSTVSRVEARVPG